MRPGDRVGLWDGSGTFRGKGPPAQRRAHRAGVDAGDPWRSRGFDLLGEHVRQSLDAQLRHLVRPPECTAGPAAGVADEYHRGVRHALEQRQTGTRDEERRGQIDVHSAQPVGRLEVCEWREPGKLGGGVHDAVE